MGLLPEFRGQGYGTKLIHIALREARRFGFIRIELTVHADNESAIRLYDKFGFM
jgi:ribosomal protein S18 acetylase RimI-like enzyme